MIKPDCRDKFTEEDYRFITSTLTENTSGRVALASLLNDNDCRDEILDHPVLYESLIKDKSIRPISPFLFFYLLTRQSLLEDGINNQEIADYVASMLAEFTDCKRLHTVGPGHDKEYSYLIDMVLDSTDTSSAEAFFIRSHLGNYALFMSSLFEDHISTESPNSRRTVGVDYYENMGKMSYHIAAQHRLAQRYQLGEILAYLSECFQTIRKALSKLSDQYLVLESDAYNLDKMLRGIFAEQDNSGWNAA